MKKAYSRPMAVFAPMNFEEHITASSGPSIGTCTWKFPSYGANGYGVYECGIGTVEYTGRGY